MEENRLTVCFELLHASEGKIEQLRAERVSIDHELLARPAIPAPDFLNLSHYRLRANKEAINLAEERRQRALAASEQRVRVQRAQQNVKLLEKMRERRLAEHTALAGRELEQLATEGYLGRWSQLRRAEEVKTAAGRLSHP